MSFVKSKKESRELKVMKHATGMHYRKGRPIQLIPVFHGISRDVGDYTKQLRN